VWSRVEQASGHWVGRLGLTVGMMLVGLGGYLAVNGRVPPRLALFTPLDEAIPFLPWTLLLYHSYYVLPLAIAMRAPPEDYLRMVRAAVPVLVVTFTCFLLLPATFPRPGWEAAGDLWGPAFRWLHQVDGPANTFPSFHVQITVLAWYRSRGWPSRWLWTAWALLVILSTMTTKQHFVADVVAGVVIAWVACRWADRA